MVITLARGSAEALGTNGPVHEAMRVRATKSAPYDATCCREAHIDDQKIRLYLLDDHEVVRQGLGALLEGAGDIEVVGSRGPRWTRRTGSPRCAPRRPPPSSRT